MGVHHLPWFGFAVLSSLFISIYGHCEFPNNWTGVWFQSGEGVTSINTTYMGNKGECHSYVRAGTYITYDREDRTFKCIWAALKHENLLQYKETYAVTRLIDQMDLCSAISMDSLFSMFRADKAKPITCPFHSAPFSFTYNGGKGDCKFPLSRVDSCTDDSRLLFRYAACADISGSQSNMEEMICLATWKDGHNKYLAAKMEHKLATSDEDKYRCFIYEKVTPREGGEVYKVAQSGDATCNGILSATDGSKMMNLTKTENQHEKCKFPSWVVQHHMWHSLDYGHSYHFMHKNATLRILGDLGDFETRIVCHKILLNTNNQVVIVAHITTECQSGFVCMVIHRREDNIIQLYQSDERSQEPSEACPSAHMDINKLPTPSTLVTGYLPALPCPTPGRYSVVPSALKLDDIETTTSQIDRCKDENSFDNLAVGCNWPPDSMDFSSSCPEELGLAYNCHGSWVDNSSKTTYIVVSPASKKSTDAKHYCFVFNENNPNQVITIHRLSKSCIIPTHRPDWSYNFISNGKCTESSASSKGSSTSSFIIPSVFGIFFSSLSLIFYR